MAVSRARRTRADAPLDEQVRDAVQLLAERGALARRLDRRARRRRFPARGRTRRAPPIAVVVEPDRAHATRELLGAAAALGGRDRRLRVGDHRRAIRRPRCSASWGADDIVHARRRQRRRRRRARASSPGPSADASAVGDRHGLDRVGSRGRVTRRRRASAPASPATRSISRPATAGSSRGSPRSAASSSPRSARRRRSRWRRCAPGMLTALARPRRSAIPGSSGST